MASVVIHRYLTADGKGVPTAKAHIRYIQHRRDDKDREPESASGRFKRDLFDGERDSLDRRELNALIDKERPGGVAIHKLTLSPGVQGVDLKEYTREVMDALGQEKGLDLIWGAAIHRNTDHDHVHVVVLGSDANGHRVRIDRKDHDLLRFRSDQYLEREHAYDRELEREEREAARVIQEHGLNREDDRLGQLLGKVARDDRGQEGERLEESRPWSREEALERLPDSQKIEVQGEIYTKYNTKEELQQLDEHLKSHYEDRIDKRQYAMMHRWIDAKERNGDDCHERWDERDFEKKRREADEGRDAHREWHELDKNARKFLEQQEFPLNRHMPREQRIFEERGRLSDFHCVYQNAMVSQALMDARERSQNPELHKYVDKELQLLKEHQQELSRELPTVDLDSLYGKKDNRDRDDERSKEPDRIGQDKDSEKEQNREQTSVLEQGREQGKDDTLNQQQQQMNDRTQELTDAQHGQEMHEGTVFKQKMDDREDDEREHDERER